MNARRLTLSVLVSLAVSAAPASAALPSEFGSKGSGAGQFLVSTGVAVNNVPASLSFGDVYVLDRKNQRIDEFSGQGELVRAFGWDVNKEKPEEKLQECTTTTGCQAGSAGGGVGQLDEPYLLGGIAVDNAFEDPLDSSVGYVYVLDQRDGRVEKFDAEGHFLLQFATGGQSVAVGPTGLVYVGEAGAVQEYDPETGEPGVRLNLEGAGAITDLAINAKSEIYVTEGSLAESASPPETHPARHYNAEGDLVSVFDEEPEGSAKSLALDAAGEVFVNQRLAGESTEQAREFSPGGIQVAAFATITLAGRGGFAFGEQTGALYTPLFFNVEVLVPSPPGPVVSRESAGGIELAAAVMHAVVNPETEKASNEAHYRVEYGACASAGACAGTVYEHSVPVPEGSLLGSFEDGPVEVPLTGLVTRTEYHYRFVATDECELEPVVNPGVTSTCATKGEDETFKTLPPALVEEVFATDVRSTSATVHARINPLGSATEYHFVYGPCEGGGECSVPVPDEQVGSGKTGVQVERHLQGLTAGQGYHYRVVTTNTLGEERGEERSFTTQTGGEAGLPDGREWELVSPPDKHGAQLFGAEEHSFIQAAADGGGIVYQANAPTEGQPRGNGAFTQVLAQRTGSSWGDLDLEVPHSFPTGVASQLPYRIFSSDLSVGVLQPAGRFEPGLSGEATEQTPYLRAGATASFTPLVTRVDDTTKPFIPFGEEGTEEQCTHTPCGPWAVGASPDLSHIVLGAGGANGRHAPLLQGTPAGSLYEWAGGKLSLISEPPENQPEEGAPTFGGSVGAGPGTLTAHAISNDGSRIFWTASGPNLLFMRDMTRKETIEIGSGAASFEGANAAGTLVLYSGRECEILVSGAHLECKPVTGENNKPLEDGTVLTTSEDGAWVYFRQGASIYTRRGSETARLVASNIGNIRPSTVEGIVPQADPWRASPNGEWFAFMSDSPLTGYDNRDAVTGQPDEEVYLYDAAAGRLVCASCDPTGARPHGAPPGQQSARSVRSELGGTRRTSARGDHSGLDTVPEHFRVV